MKGIIQVMSKHQNVAKYARCSNISITITIPSEWPQWHSCKNLQEIIAFEADHPGSMVVLPHLSMYSETTWQIELMATLTRLKVDWDMDGHITKSMFYTKEQWRGMHPSTKEKRKEKQCTMQQ